MKAALRGVSVLYPGGVAALSGVDLDVGEGGISILVGPSGAGKSTVLKCLNGTVKPTLGEVLIDGVDITGVDAPALRDVRRRIALIPQQFNLVRRESVLTNVLAGRLGSVALVPGLLGFFSHEDREIAMSHIARLELDDKMDRRVDTLSGGEQQRVAIARALTQQPEMILADEPVSSLDPDLAVATMELFRRINREDRITMLIALHDFRLVARYADTIVALQRGRIADASRFEDVVGRLGP